MSSVQAALDTLKVAFSTFEPPYCSGTVPLEDTTSTLFYRSGDKSNFVDFANITDAQLLSLAQACQPASFGKNKEDVIDESYRKAGKIDPTHFATLFSPVTSGVIDAVRESLLRDQNMDKAIRAELYKLNVYGPGQFFKAHVDTPRSDTMFGSLVVILPTVHQGGSLLFRHQGKEQSFDTANLVSSQPTPHAAFVAFFSDVEHEVAVVTSGYRVTLTYNLYFIDRPPPPLPTASPSTEASLQIKSALQALLAEPTFLPEGGFIGLGLSHKYPVKPGKTELTDIEKSLKGSDAVLHSIFKDLSFDGSLRILYNGDIKDVYLLLDDLRSFPELTESELEEDILYHIRTEYGGLYVYNDAPGGLTVPKIEYMADAEAIEIATPIVWAKPLTNVNTFETPYIAHFGNSPGLDHTYGSVCLVAPIGTPNDRHNPDASLKR